MTHQHETLLGPGLRGEHDRGQRDTRKCQTVVVNLFLDHPFSPTYHDHDRQTTMVPSKPLHLASYAVRRLSCPLRGRSESDHHDLGERGHVQREPTVLRHVRTGGDGAIRQEHHGSAAASLFPSVMSTPPVSS